MGTISEIKDKPMPKSKLIDTGISWQNRTEVPRLTAQESLNFQQQKVVRLSLPSMHMMILYEHTLSHAQNCSGNFDNFQNYNFKVMVNVSLLRLLSSGKMKTLV